MQLLPRYNLTPQDWEKLNTEDPLSQEDRYKFQSATFKTLISSLGTDFSPSELQEVYRLETLNLKTVVSLAYGLLFPNSTLLAMIRSMPNYNAIVGRINGQHSNLRMRKRVFFETFMRYILSRSNPDMKAKFKGSIPPKAFSFCQMETEKWFSDYCTWISHFGGVILLKSNEEQTLAFFMANTAYYLNKSQTFKYYPKPNESQNDAIGRIIREFLDDGSAESRNIINKLDTIPFFKDI